MSPHRRSPLFRARPLLLAALLPGAALAADGDLDTTFSADGKATVLWDEDGPTYAEVRAIAPLPDGSMVLGGDLIWDPPADAIRSHWILAKLSRTGPIDSSWGDSGRRRISFELVDGGFDRLLGLWAEPDGSVMVAGWTSNGVTQIPALARLTPEGEGDPAFGDAGYLYVNDLPWADPALYFGGAVRQRDGKIVLAGHCLRCPSNTTHYNAFAVRFLPSGALDATLSFDGWAAISDGGTTNDLFGAVATSGDGKVHLAYNADGDPRVARLNLIGGFDGSWSGDGVADVDPGVGVDTITALAVDPATDEVYVVFTTNLFDVNVGIVTRYTASGAHDDAYGEGENVFALEDTLRLDAATLQDDGRILVAGKMNPPGPQAGGFFVARLDDSGDRDTSFAGNGMARYEIDRVANAEDAALAIALSGGRPVVAGYAFDAADETDMAVVRLQGAAVFRDGFEAGETLSWSATEP
jgi:uncharacterized delta-60 repeat protein